MIHNKELTLQALQDGRKRIETVGWCQGSYKRYNPLTGQAVSFCMVGSIFESRLSLVASDGAISLLSLAVDGPVAAWNDEPSRTKEEVLAAFDVAIAML